MSEAEDTRCERAMLQCGLSESEARQAKGNTKLRRHVLAVMEEAGVFGSVEGGGGGEGKSYPKQTGALLYSIATRFPHALLAAAPERRKTVVRYCIEGGIKSSEQLEAAIAFMRALPEGDAVDAASFEESCGVGVEVSDDELHSAVATLLKEHEEQLIAERYRFSNPLFGRVRFVVPELKWADGRKLKTCYDAAVLALLGEKTEADLAKPKKEKKKKKGDDAAAPADADTSNADASTGAGGINGNADDESASSGGADPFAMFPRPEVNHDMHTEVRYSDGTNAVMKNSRETLHRHLDATGGRVVTRFPPEPNGYLHIGHAKACFIDFGLAEATGGSTILRYDDTNPTAEKQEYITHIQDIVSWLGWKWEKVTYSSDYFGELYELACELIRRGKAYVCHQTAADIKEYREKQMDSPWRDRPIEENLRIFNEMRMGIWDEGSATLRMKGDMRNENANMMDLIAYRIKFSEHPHAGDKWCIYPSYDFTHCIVDSIENVTHSLCTIEFEVRRASYYWLLDALDVYMPYVWEYSRLNICHNVLSKRKLNRLVTEKYVDGWDDPRLLTLSGLRRRGYTPAAINEFCRSLGISRTENLIPLHKLEHCIRSDLNDSAPRAMAVLRPLRVVITNMDAKHLEYVSAAKWPNRRGAEEHYDLPLTRVLYIDRDDFRDQDSKGYYGLAPGKSVLLRYAYPITCTNVMRSPSGEVMELHCTYDASRSSKPKGVLHWVAEPSPGTAPQKADFRLYTELFKTADVSSVDDWLGDLNPNSLTVIRNGVVSRTLADAKPLENYQFERVGYFCRDPVSSSDSGALVFNRTVTLKETEGAASARKAK